MNAVSASQAIDYGTNAIIIVGCLGNWGSLTVGDGSQRVGIEGWGDAIWLATATIGHPV
jgi:hypothetical protein